MDTWKTTARKTVLENNKFLTVEYHTVELPDGRVIDDWSWVITPDFVNVVVMDEAGRFVMFRQGKYGYDGMSIAPIGGYIEPNEAPLLAAKRETLEEMGYEAATWVDMGTYRVDANRGAGTAYLYLALSAKKVTEPIVDDLEEQEIVFLTEAELEEALFTQQVKVIPWAHLVAMSLLYLRKQR